MPVAALVQSRIQFVKVLCALFQIDVLQTPHVDDEDQAIECISQRICIFQFRTQVIQKVKVKNRYISQR